MKMDPDAISTNNSENNLSFPTGSALPIYSTGSTPIISPHKSVQSQSDFVGLLLEAAQLIEKDQSAKSPTVRNVPSMAANIQNAAELLSVSVAILSSNELFFC